MLFGWVGVAFILEHFQRSDQFRTGVARLDDLVDVAATSGDVGIGELFFKLIYARSAGRRFI